MELKLSEKVNGFKCVNCGAEYSLEFRYTCDKCSNNLDVVYNYELIKKHISREVLRDNKDLSVHRYWNLLPLQEHKYISSLNIGNTPIYNIKKFGIPNLFIKDDGRNPSASFKDRASVVALAKGLELGFKIISGASTGNAAASLACLAASLGIPVNIFVPQTAPIAKIAQLLIFNANVIMVKGNYDQAFDLCIEACKEYGWFNRNTGYNPFTKEGKKVCSYEICEQLNWNPIDKVIVSVGDGNIISGLWKGFKDFYNVGLIDKLPQMIGVQAEGSSAIANALQNNGIIEPVQANTIADSISVDLPRDGVAAVKAIKESNGQAVIVSDNEILDAMKILGKEVGVFGEPAGVTSFAGFLKLLKNNSIKENETVCTIITGNGLKDIQSAIKAISPPEPIEPSLEGLKKFLNK